MAEPVIEVSRLTKDYGEGRGIFNVSFEVEPGEVFGYLGTNGSGKTTTIRHMMGFVKQDDGAVRVNGLNPWKKAPELMRHVSYIPGEIEFPSLSTGNAFFKLQARYLGIRDLSRMKHLIDVLDLDPSANLKRMSKGMKQKTAVVAALMAERDILILDEPTTGLDPLMRENFLEIIREEKAMGHTVFMSTHIFSEVEDVCDRVGILHNGKITEVLNLSQFRNSSPRRMTIEFEQEADAQSYAQTWPGAAVSGNEISCEIPPDDMNRFLGSLNGLPVATVHEEHIGLEEYFMSQYHTR